MEGRTQGEAETQTGARVVCCRECPVGDVRGYCGDCRRPFCRECMEDHIGHGAERLGDFCERRRRDILSQVSLWELAVQLEGRRAEMAAECEALASERRDVERCVALGENSDAACERELERLEGAVRFLVGLEEEAATVALKSACSEALGLFDLADRVRAELRALTEGLESARARAGELARELDELRADVGTLGYLRGEDGAYELDDEKWAVFLLLNERTPLFTPPECCIDTTVDSFRAFPGLGRVFDIEGVMQKPLVSVREGVRMSAPLRVEKGLIGGDYIFASLSHRGVLAICVDGSTIQFTDLNDDRQVETGVEDWTLVGFYDEMALLLTCGRPLREAAVADVFGSPALGTFGVIEGTVPLVPDTDVSLLNARRVLYYRTADYRLFAFNVDTRANTEVDVGRKVNTIISPTGIDPGVRAVFYTNDEHTCTLNMDGTVTEVDEGRNTWITALSLSTPSQGGRPNTASKGRSSTGREGEPETPQLARFDGYAIVRVYRDVFLGYDENTESWGLFRISTR